MRDFVIITDSSCDLPFEYIESNNIVLLPLNIEIKGVNYKDIVELDIDTFYSLIDEKDAVPKTSAVNSFVFEEVFTHQLSLNKDILYIGLSSKVSSTFNFAEVAKNTLNDTRIHLVDSRSAAFGQGLLVKEAVDMKNNGSSISEIIEYLEELKAKLDYAVMINDIEMLKRSGRISSIQAFAGDILSIKPVITVDDGEVKVLRKVRGKKSAIKLLIDRLIEIGVDKKYPIIICYGADLDLRNEVESKLNSNFNHIRIESMRIGATIGSHTGKYGVGILFVRSN